MASSCRLPGQLSYVWKVRTLCIAIANLLLVFLPAYSYLEIILSLISTSSLWEHLSAKLGLGLLFGGFNLGKPLTMSRIGLFLTS